MHHHQYIPMLTKQKEIVFQCLHCKQIRPLATAWDFLLFFIERCAGILISFLFYFCLPQIPRMPLLVVSVCLIFLFLFCTRSIFVFFLKKLKKLDVFIGKR